jgi:hypothetical protein
MVCLVDALSLLLTEMGALEGGHGIMLHLVFTYLRYHATIETFYDKALILVGC